MHRQTPKKLTVPEAAAIMDVDPQFLRIALRQERLEDKLWRGGGRETPDTACRIEALPCGCQG